MINSVMSVQNFNITSRCGASRRAGLPVFYPVARHAQPSVRPFQGPSLRGPTMTPTNRDDRGEIYPTMLNEVNCTFGVSFSRYRHDIGPSLQLGL